MRIMALVLLVVAQFTVLPFLGRVTANTMRQVRDAAHETRGTPKAAMTEHTEISTESEL